MTRVVRALTALALLFAAIASGSLSASAAEDSPLAFSVGAASSPADDAIARFGACLAGGGEGDLLLLIDESNSLTKTDPQAARVAAAAYLIRQLVSFADNSSSTVDVKIAAFGYKYSTAIDWTRLSAASEPGLLSTVSSFSARTNGFETDYWSALEGSRRDLADRKAARTSVESCQAIAWFTDGELAYVPRNAGWKLEKYGSTKPFAEGIVLNSKSAAAQVTDLARQDLCRGGGLADQLRSSDVAVFGIGLQSATTPSDFSFLNAVVTGSDAASGTTCGSITHPSPGVFQEASNIDSLLFAFDKLSTPGSDPITQEAGICQGVVCYTESHRFILDASTPSVHILATSEATGLDVVLRSPDGSLVPLPSAGVGAAADASIDDATIAYTWQSDKTVEIDLHSTDDAAAWSGLWQLIFVDPSSTTSGQKSLSNFHIFSDLVPAWLNAVDSKLHVGDVLDDVQLGVVNTEGEAIELDEILGTVSYSAVLVDSKGDSTIVADELSAVEVAEPLTLDLSDASTGAASLTLTLAITTAALTSNGVVVEPGTALEPQSVEIPLSIRPPLDYPDIATELNFGTLEQTTMTATLAVDGKGCLWLDPASGVEVVASPAHVGDVVVSVGDATSGETCFEVSGKKSVDVDLVIDSLDNGTINGTVDVMIAPSAELDRAIPVSVHFTADVRKPLNAVNWVLALIVALILGPGIPIGLLYLLKWLAAKIPSRALLVERIPVTISEGRVLRDGATFALRPTDFRELTGIAPGGVRSLQVAGVSFSTRIGFLPTGAGFVVASAPGTVSASDSNPASVGKDLQARLPLAVHNRWIVLRDPRAAEGAAEVVVMVSGDASVERKDDLVEDLNSRLPDVYAQLIENSGEASIGSADDEPLGFGTSDSSTTQGFGFDSFDSPGATTGGGGGFGFDDDLPVR